MNIKTRFKLTQREFQCVELLIEKNTAKAIAKKLNISYRTVEAHFNNIMNKYNCKNRYEIMEIYFQQKNN